MNGTGFWKLPGEPGLLNVVFGNGGGLPEGDVPKFGNEGNEGQKQFARPAPPPMALPTSLVAIPQAACKAARAHGSVIPEQIAIRLIRSQTQSAGRSLRS